MPTVACDSLSPELSMVFSGEADQINWSAFLNWGTVLASVAACDKTPALPQTW